MNYKIKSRIWIESSEGVFLGEGRIKLLRAIADHGSLSSAAKSLKMSYKKAWNLVDGINKSAEHPVVSTNTGGSGGGGSEITAYGQKMIKVFENINQNCWNFLDKELKNNQL